MRLFLAYSWFLLSCACVVWALDSLSFLGVVAWRLPEWFPRVLAAWALWTFALGQADTYLATR